jgi:hypothetical protein
MKARLTVAALLLSAGASALAQQSEPAPVPAPALSAAEAAALEPGVDVSQRVARPAAAAPGAPAAPAAPAQPAAPRPAPRTVDSLDLGTTSITGNQELPKVLYIVPWKRSDLGDLLGRPVNTLLDEVLAPVDPDVFERQLGYYETLHEAAREE